MIEFRSDPGFAGDDLAGKNLTGKNMAEALRQLAPGLKADAPALGFAGGGADPCRLVWANPAIFALFGARGARDLALRLFFGPEPGAKRFVHLAAHLPPGGPARLEKLRFFLGPATQTITFLCRRVELGGGESPLFLAAALDAPDGFSRPPAETSDAVAARKIIEVERAGAESRQTTDIGAIRAELAGGADARAIRFLWRTDAEGRILDVEAPFARIIGVAAERLIGHGFAEIVGRLAPGAEAALLEEFAQQRTIRAFAAMLPIAGAAVMAPVSLSGAPRFDRNGAFEGYRGFGVIDLDGLTEAAIDDASARPKPSLREEAAGDVDLAPQQSPPLAPPRSAQIALAEGRGAAPSDRFPSDIRAVLDRLPLGVLLRREGEALFANRHLLDALGCADLGSALAGPPVGAGPLERVLAALPRLSRQGATIEGATIELRLEDQPRRLHLRAEIFVLADEQVELITLRPVAADAGAETDLRRAEGKLRELNAILDTATDGVALLNGRGEIVSLNRSGEALFGYDESEVVGEPFSILLAPESRGRARDYLEGLKADGVASLLNDGREVIGLPRQGGAIPIFMTLGRLSASPERRAGEEGGFCALFRDLTHWKKVERELEDARREAERLSALKSDFLAKISHEIRTPLNAILGFAEVIMDQRFGPIGNERYRDYLRDIHSSGSLVMSLVNDLLDLSKIEAGKMDLDFRAVDVNRAVAECVSIMQPQASRARVVMRLSLAARPPHVYADERSLRQIVLNLLSNAVKFNQPGGQVIVATTCADSGRIALRIRDTGIGMSAAEIEIALEPFRQIATSRPSGGTGLGLPLTKALIEANRASFSITSKKDEGTLVEVAFSPARVLAD